MAIHFTSGDKKEAVDIMREAAQWLIDIGQPMWNIEDLTFEHLTNPPDEFHVMWNGQESVAAMTLSFEDKIFWADVAANTSGFIHKLSVRRKFADKGYAKMLVEYAKKVCFDKEIYYLRLDCDPHRKGLLNFYDSCGFTLVEMKQLNTPKLGIIDLAMYEMKLDRTRT